MAIDKNVKAYIEHYPPDQNFQGTEAGWQQYRQNYINNCAYANERSYTGVRRRQHALGLCTVGFDNLTANYQQDMYAQDAENLAAVKANNEKLQGTAVVALILVLLIGLIVWLLTSA